MGLLARIYGIYFKSKSKYYIHLLFIIFLIKFLLDFNKLFSISVSLVGGETEMNNNKQLKKFFFSQIRNIINK
jgi:hypothetical protein